MGVPNTSTFALSDVVSVVNPSINSLSNCFTHSIDALFDPLYKGSKDRLSNFRNYKGAGGYTEVDSRGATGVIYKIGSVGGTWTSVRDAVSGALNTSHPPEVWVNSSGGRYYVYRQFVRFDLSGIHSSYSCTSAYIHWRVTARHGTNRDAILLIANVGATLLTGDFDNYGSTVAFNGTQTIGTLTVPCVADYYRKIEASTADKTVIAGKFGGYLDMVIINRYHDYYNSAPTSKQGFDGWSAGERITGCLYEPELQVNYG